MPNDRDRLEHLVEAALQPLGVMVLLRGRELQRRGDLVGLAALRDAVQGRARECERLTRKLTGMLGDMGDFDVLWQGFTWSQWGVLRELSAGGIEFLPGNSVHQALVRKRLVWGPGEESAGRVTQFGSGFLKWVTPELMWTSASGFGFRWRGGEYTGRLANDDERRAGQATLLSSRGSVRMTRDRDGVSEFVENPGGGRRKDNAFLSWVAEQWCEVLRREEQGSLADSDWRGGLSAAQIRVLRGGVQISLERDRQDIYGRDFPPELLYGELVYRGEEPWFQGNGGILESLAELGPGVRVRLSSQAMAKRWSEGCDG